MQIAIVKNSFVRMLIFFSYNIAHESLFKMIPVAKNLSRNIRFAGVNVDMSARNRSFQTNFWCITIYIPTNIQIVYFQQQMGQCFIKPKCLRWPSNTMEIVEDIFRRVSWRQEFK